MNKTWTAGLIACTALLVAACSKPAPAPEPVRSVRTLTLGAEEVRGEDEYAAEIRPRVESRLGFRVGGKILARGVELGDSVRSGQLLARLDPQDLKLGQEAAQAAVAAARSNLDIAESDFKRAVSLKDQGFISGADLERREAGLKAARAAFDQAQAQWKVQANQSSYAALLADAPGVITAVEAEPGMVVGAGATVVRLAHDGPRDAWFSVPEDRVTAWRALKGRPGGVQVRLWGETGAFKPATVREVAAAADPATRTFLIKADLGAMPARLGQTATVVLQGRKSNSSIKLPLTAVFEQAGQATVWVLDTASMTLKAQPVQVGGAEGNRVLIAQGLSAGQTVVVAGVHTLAAGQKVRQYVEPGQTPASASMVKAAASAASANR
ncbi:MAG: hypothetical protein RI949_1641 [Pseudomonadota bacterium]|jgi:RND family efflux transporter MFP subunit